MIDKLKKTGLMILVAGSIALVAGCGGGSGGGGSADNIAPTIANPVVTVPSSISGTSIGISCTATDDKAMGTVVASVTRVSTSAKSNVTLSTTGAGLYSGTYTIVDKGSKSEDFVVVVTAKDAAGNQSTFSKTVTVIGIPPAPDPPSL